MTTHRRFASGLLRRAVASVLAQDYTDFEFVICDDASTDGSADYLAGVAARDPRVKLIRNPRNVNSVAISLGRCMQAADPARRWVSWMFDDCILRPGALSRLARAVAAGGEVKMVFGVTEVLAPDGAPPLRVGAAPPEEIRRGVANSSILVPNGGILIDRAVFERVGWYDPSIVLRRSCDWDLFRRIIGAGVPFATLPDVLMEEHGALQSDSLRNAFTTSFDLMQRYCAARDAAGLSLDLANCLAMPVDWIPPGFWTSDEVALMQYMFVEYFLSVGDVPRAFHWARRLEEALPRPSLMRENLLRCATVRDPAAGEEESGPDPMAAGAYAALVFSAYGQHLVERQAAVAPAQGLAA